MGKHHVTPTREGGAPADAKHVSAGLWQTLISLWQSLRLKIKTTEPPNDNLKKPKVSFLEFK